MTSYLGVSTTWEWQLWEIFPILHLSCQIYTEKDRQEKLLVQMCPQSHSQDRTNCHGLCAVFIGNVRLWKQTAFFCSNVTRSFKGERQSSFKMWCVRLKIILMKKWEWSKINTQVAYKLIGASLSQVNHNELGEWEQHKQLPSSV